MEKFNKLTPAEEERLAMLAEECGEIVQIVGKILRHGYDSYHPDDDNKTTNRELLRGELTDLLAVSSVMQFEGDITKDSAFSIACAKSRKLSYAHHQ